MVKIASWVDAGSPAASPRDEATMAAAMTSPLGERPSRSRRSSYLAAATALGLGVVAATSLIAGHQPWEGRVVASVYGTHGLHAGDGFALVPLVVGAALAWWCLHARR